MRIVKGKTTIENSDEDTESIERQKCLKLKKEKNSNALQNGLKEMQPESRIKRKINTFEDCQGKERTRKTLDKDIEGMKGQKGS